VATSFRERARRWSAALALALATTPALVTADPVEARTVTAPGHDRQDGLAETGRIELARRPLSVVFTWENAGRRHSLSVRDARTGRTWTAVGTDRDTGRIFHVEQNGPDSMSLTFRHCQAESVFTCTVAVEEDGVLSFAIDAADRECEFGWLNYPPVFHASLEDGALLFCDRSAGVLLPQADSSYPTKTLTCYGNIAALDMPWMGIIDRGRGDGMMVLLETPCDVALRLEPDAGGNQWPRVIWKPALGAFAYPRRVSYRFSPEGGYVALAKAYRAYAKHTGLIKPLRERVAERPRVAWLRGAPSIWGADGLDFAREAHTLGIRRALINGGRFSPEELRAMTALGFLTGEYDSYTDILEGDRGFQRDNIEAAAYHTKDGTPAPGWRTLDGLQYYTRSSALARKAAEIYVPKILEKYPFTARFIDVSSCIDLYEDYHPDHRFDRRADMAYRRNLYKYFIDLGLVVGGEHGKAWVQPYLDYTEGTMSGSFWWQWPAGHLVAPKRREDLTPDYVKFGIDYRHRIPLYELVFHGCVASTWYWGDSSGFFYEVAPDLSDRKDLFNILYGTVPLMWADDKGYGWSRHRDRFLETYRTTCPLHEVVCFDELLEHEFLSDDAALQRTRFSSGTIAVVNFSDEPRPYTCDEARVVLAPRGFFVKGPNITEYRLVEGVDSPEMRGTTLIEKSDFIFVDGPGPWDVGPVTGQGQFCMFDAGNSRWHIIARGGGRYEVNLAAIKGFPEGASFRFVVIDAQGRPLREAPYDRSGDTFSFTSTPDTGLFAALLGRSDEEGPAPPTGR